MNTEFGDFPGAYEGDSVDRMINWFRAKTPMDANEFYLLDAEARGRAFTVSGVAELDMVSDVMRAVDSAISNGETLADFQARIGTDLTALWGGEDPARLETIFRTNVQSAYSVGRFIQNNKPEVKATHPYSKFSAVLDDRTTDICEECDGTILPTDDPWWADHQPPLHFNCRSDVSAITPEEAEELGVDDAAPEVDADDGFGVPGADPDFDLSTRPPDLTAIYEMKQQLENQDGGVL